MCLKINFNIFLKIIDKKLGYIIFILYLCTIIRNNNMSEECNEEPWFTATVINSVEHPIGFMTWTENITKNKYNINLPDGSKTHAKLFMDLHQRFDNNEYTRYLVNRYNEIQSI